MKKLKIISILTLLAIVFVACKNKDIKNKENASKSEGIVKMSNMADKESIEDVKNTLKSQLKAENVDEFMNYVSDYNNTIENTNLNSGFEKLESTDYDLEKLDKLWKAKKGQFPGTNCRINTFMLLKDNIEIKDMKYDDSSLFIDKDAINMKNIFSDEELEKFNMLFSRVKTEDTKNVKIHQKKMEEFFSNIKFNEDAEMISLVLHDNIDGDYLFIGHSGVLVEDKDGGYLFVEKLSFIEPYQALKFDNKNDLYKYLSEKYEKYKDDQSAPPFIMDNGKAVEYNI